MTREELFQKLLDVLREDLRFYAPMIKEVAADMVRDGFTKYPVFIAHQHEVKLGEPILLREDFAREFSIHATTLEELCERNLILPERKEEFILNYKNPKEQMCILLITPQEASFIYVPYKLKPREATGD